MRWLIPSERYKDLLEKREKYIGRNFTESLSTLVSGAAMIIGAVLSDYSSLSGALRLTVMFANYALALGLTIGGVIMTILAAHDRYTAKRLYEETADLNEIEHRYSIVAVKDTFQKYPSRFLLYYDKRWRCNFFFSFPTAETDEKDILDISTRLSGALQIPAQQIQLEKRGFDLSRKYSVSHEENRTYAHTFYSAVIPFTPELMKNDFVLSDVHYRWMTIDEMKNDPRIHEINLDVVSAVERYIP